MRRGGIVLCGGLSQRMGHDKAGLPFGPESMLARVVRLLADVVEPVVVVAAVGQTLPAIPNNIEVVRDEHSERGPLEGLAAGLRACRESADACYVTGCDTPRLVPAFVSRMFELLGDYDAAVPIVDGHRQPLSAVYRLSLLPQIDELRQNGTSGPRGLLAKVRAREVAEDKVTDVDPDLVSITNINHPADYFQAVRACGFEVPDEVRSQLSR